MAKKKRKSLVGNLDTVGKKLDKDLNKIGKDIDKGLTKAINRSSKL